MESIRIDVWLWSVRLTKTRADAASACKGGHVRIDDRPAKPATTVAPGATVRVRVYDRNRVVEVVRVIRKRVGATEAQTCYLDNSPPPEPSMNFPVARRDRGAGRPTKRDRRVIDQLRQR